MTQTALGEDLRAKIISDPAAVLEDRDLMQVLIAANDHAKGDNIVDLRGAAMQRLETRLDALEDTHRNVIAAAYENLAGTNQIHRAVLRMLEPKDFKQFLALLRGDVANILRVDDVRLVLETRQEQESKALGALDDVLHIAEPGFVARYMQLGRLAQGQVILRRVGATGADVYGAKGDEMRSEALMSLDLGAGRLPGMLVMGSHDPKLFTPAHGTDLLGFFAGVFERSMGRWLG